MILNGIIRATEDVDLQRQVPSLIFIAQRGDRLLDSAFETAKHHEPSLESYRRRPFRGNFPARLLKPQCGRLQGRHLGFGFFKGRVTLKQHDYIHIVLGRGLMLMDEAFVIGFTMGSSNRVSTQEKEIFSFIASKLYPKPYRFTKNGTQVFKDAVHMGYISDCDPLEGVDFEPLLDLPLGEVRRRIKLEADFLRAYYRIEARRYPDSAMSQRLVSNDPVNL